MGSMLRGFGKIAVGVGVVAILVLVGCAQPQAGRTTAVTGPAKAVTPAVQPAPTAPVVKTELPAKVEPKVEVKPEVKVTPPVVTVPKPEVKVEPPVVTVPKPEVKPVPPVKVEPKADAKVQPVVEPTEDAAKKLLEQMARDYPADRAEWVLDDLAAAKLPWGTEKWGNPVQVSVAEKDGVKQLVAKVEAGKEDKAVVRRALRMDCSSRAALALDVVNGTEAPVGLAVAVITDEWYETPVKKLQPGDNKGVSFDLTAGDFKAKSTEWQYKTAVKQLDKPSGLYLLVYTKDAGEFRLSNVRLVKAQ